MSGKLLQSEKITGNQTSVFISNLAPSTYFVRVITGTMTETDPTYTSSEAANITVTDITNLSNLSNINTGDQGEKVKL